MKIKRNIGMVAIVAMMALVSVGCGGGTPDDLPPEAMYGDDAIMAVVIDIEGVSKDKIKAAALSLIGEMPDEARDQLTQSMDKNMEKFGEQWAAFHDTGVKRIALVVPAKSDRDSVEPAGPPVVAMYAPGKTPADLKEGAKKLAEAEVGSSEKADKIEFEPIGGDWFYVKDDEVAPLPAKPNAEIAKAMTDRLKSGGGAITVAMHMSDPNRSAYKAMLDSGELGIPAIGKPLANVMMEMDGGTISVGFGQKPEAKVVLAFPDAEIAEKFTQMADGMITSGQGILSERLKMLPEDMEGRPTNDDVEAMVATIRPQQSDNQVTVRLGSEFIQASQNFSKLFMMAVPPRQQPTETMIETSPNQFGSPGY